MNSALTPAVLAPWRWRDGIGGLLTGMVLFLAMLAVRPALMQLWRDMVDLWSLATGLPALDGELVLSPPATGLLLGTAATVLGLYALAGRWHERLYPLRVLVRALCLIQASACLFFAWAPARFPYGPGQHLSGLLWMGADLITVLPLLLMAGWGMLRMPWHLRVLGSLTVLGYFVAWVPHQVLLHAWVLVHGTALFMPLLMLCLGPLLNGWLFVALYAWLASLTPAPVAAPRSGP